MENVIGYFDKANEFFVKGLEVLRDVVGKVAGLMSIDQQLAIVLVSLVVSIYIGYFLMSKFTTHPLNANNIVYIIFLAFLMFELLVYL